VKDRMVSIAGGLESTAWCGLLLWVVVCAKVEWVFAPFSTWFQGKWDNLWCDGWFHFHGTCSMQVSLCMGLGHDCGHDLGSRLFGCMGGGSLIEGPLASFLWRWSEIIFLVLWWPSTIRINVVHGPSTTTLIIIVTWSCGFI
jgi:hypothetical protein